jgi:hypothetical protein
MTYRSSYKLTTCATVHFTREHMSLCCDRTATSSDSTWRGLGTYSSCSQDWIEPGEGSWSVVGASWLSSRRRASGDRTAWPQRTEDYQQNGYQNHPTSVLLVSKPRPLKSYSLGLQDRGLRRSIGHLWGVGAEFSRRDKSTGCEMDPHFREAWRHEMDPHFREAWRLWDGSLF